MMSFDEFLDAAKDRVQEALPDAKVTIQQVNKLQGESYTGIAVQPECAAAAVTFNVSPAFEHYQADESQEAAILNKIAADAKMAANAIPVFELSEITDYETVKNNLVMQVVPVEPNKEMLENIPHKTVEDIAVVYRVELPGRADGSASTLVTNKLLEEYGVTPEQLHMDAIAAQLVSHPPVLKNMSEMMAEMSGGMFDMPESPMWVATVEGGMNGAFVTQLPDFLQQAAERLGGDFFVLPSSVHEVLFIRDDGSFERDQLESMVRGVNATEVSEADFLSDSVYHYDSDGHIFEKAVNGVPVEGQIWDVDRLFRVCCSDTGRQIIEIDFTEYCDEGIPCLEASSAVTDQYSSYLGVIPGVVLADIYDKFGSKLLEGNVRSFLSTKVAVNKKIRNTILNSPEMFFAYNNGISCTAMDVQIRNTDHGRFITYAKDFQIINGGQTTASISNARYKDKAVLDGLYVQMKLTAIDETTQEETDELIRNISRSSNSQNKVSDADFFASHPFHRRMEQISRHLFAPAVAGAQYETKWFYERARGQYLQEQMRLTPAKKKQFELANPKNKVIKKTDLAKVQNTWRGYPQVVSKGAQTNFNAFAEYIDEEWNSNERQFNERYFQSTAALILMFQ